jgi:peroxiredoxin
MFSYANLTPGDPAPWFYQRTFSNPRFAFNTVAGRYVVLCFFGSAANPRSRAALEAVLSRSAFFDDQTAVFFGVTQDKSDEADRGLADRVPGYRFFLDFDGSISQLYGAVPNEASVGEATRNIRRLWIVLDPTLRVLKTISFAPDGSDIGALLSFLDALPPPDQFAGFPLQAPILVLPNVFEPEFCRELIGRYEKSGGDESGFVREVDGRTVMVHDHGHKRRKDHLRY